MLAVPMHHASGTGTVHAVRILLDRDRMDL